MYFYLYTSNVDVSTNREQTVSLSDSLSWDLTARPPRRPFHSDYQQADWTHYIALLKSLFRVLVCMVFNLLAQQYLTRVPLQPQRMIHHVNFEDSPCTTFVFNRHAVHQWPSAKPLFKELSYRKTARAAF